MENLGGGYGQQPKQQHGTDEYGNPIQQGGLTGAGGHENVKDKLMEKLPGGHKQEQQGLSTGTQGQSQLRRSGSSSSSSSEDDGMGGRRKKGIKDKIKEKLPGGHKQEQPNQPGTGGTYGAGGGGYGEQTHEKKGMMDNIKDKLPGGTGQR